MKRIAKTGCLMVALALLWSSGASANHLSLTERTFKETYSPIRVIPTFGIEFTCNVTLEGSYHSNTIAKTERALIGYIRGATVGACETGRMRANTETLPWHVRYMAFSGALPNITAVTRSLDLNFTTGTETFGLPPEPLCRYSVSELVLGRREARGVITEQQTGNETWASQVEGCPSVRLAGSGRVTTAGGASIAISLI